MMKQQDEKDQQIIDQVLRGGRQADYALLVDSYRARPNVNILSNKV